MAQDEKVEEGKKRKRVDNIITLQDGDSEESIEEVSNLF